jgi:Domain of unknown function (DUF4955)/Pectate lyase superfamily protein
MRKFTGLSLLALATTGCQSAKIWEQYESSQKNGTQAILPDYSYAGYNRGERGIPAATGRIFDVTEFGAEPNDGKSDRAAVEKAIRAAEANGGGIVFFPPGCFCINEKEGVKKGIVINADNIILKGSGSGPGGTEVFMKHHMMPKNPKQMWSVPNMFNFVLPPERNKRHVLTTITADSNRETFVITVADAEKLKVGDFVILEMRNPNANKDFLAGMKTWDIWTTTNKKGVWVRGEKHQIKSIDGKKLTFKEPIHCDIKAKYGWQVKACPLGRGWGVEDIHFRGNFKDKFKHHSSFIHDSGWSMLAFTRGLFPYARRCRFTDVSSSIGLGACFGGTIINCAVEGRQGHCSFASGYYSYGTLIAFCSDMIKDGSFHGYASSAGSVGTVITHSKNSNRGFDWHGSWPYCTLIDDCSGGLIGNGGNYVSLPNHMQYLTFWNFKQTAGKVYNQYDFWESRKGKQNYSGAKIVKPLIVGFHGNKKSTFKQESCLLIESCGKPVKPKSLYKAQLQLRLGKLPEWLNRAEKEYKFYKKNKYYNHK